MAKVKTQTQKAAQTGKRFAAYRWLVVVLAALVLYNAVTSIFKIAPPLTEPFAGIISGGLLVVFGLLIWPMTFPAVLLLLAGGLKVYQSVRQS